MLANVQRRALLCAPMHKSHMLCSAAPRGGTERHTQALRMASVAQGCSLLTAGWLQPVFTLPLLTVSCCLLQHPFHLHGHHFYVSLPAFLLLVHFPAPTGGACRCTFTENVFSPKTCSAVRGPLEG